MFKGWEVICTMYVQHNHSTSSAATYAKNRVSDDTKSKLSELFSAGYSPVEALEQLKIDVDDNPLLLADRSIIPSYQFCN